MMNVRVWGILLCSIVIFGCGGTQEKAASTSKTKGQEYHNEPVAGALLDTSFCAKDYEVYSKTCMFWLSAWEEELVSLHDSAQLQHADLVRTTTAAELKQYLNRCPSCTEVRIFFVGSQSTQLPVPDLALVNAKSCNESYDATPQVFLLTRDSDSLVSPDSLKSAAEAWVSNPFQSKPYNRPIWAYTFERKTIWDIVQTDTTEIRFEFAYHTDNSKLPEDDMKGKMILDVLVHKAGSQTFHDFASPCPYICGSSGKMYSYYPDTLPPASL